MLTGWVCSVFVLVSDGGRASSCGGCILYMGVYGVLVSCAFCICDCVR